MILFFSAFTTGLSLTAIPFIVFKIPGIGEMFHQMRPTGYDAAGNVQSVLFAEDEPAFAVGVLAGATTSTKTVCGIFGVPFPALRKFRNGFAEGVVHECPTCKVITQYIHSFGDLALGGEVATHFIQEKQCDVLFGAAGYRSDYARGVHGASPLEEHAACHHT